MTEEIDEGPVILQEGLIFSRSDDYVSIRIKVYRHAFDLMARAVVKILQDNSDYSHTDYPRQGRYFKVIDPDKMAAAIDKVSRGEYAYQTQ
jgi:folate-dependent phosphoribosylglycinamide formyltransferase PurN